uniref:F-box domain-containing protein n=1 Tax=Steinernema glaseri TaxID=37863 RepID=A0A1I8AGC9_9BILA
MEFVPVPFVDALCTALRKKDLENLKLIRSQWCSTVERHHSKRREFTLRLDANHDGTQVGIAVWTLIENPLALPRDLTCASLSKYDRIISITVGDATFADSPEKVPVHHFRAKILPLIRSLASNYTFFNWSSDKSQKGLSDRFFSNLQGRVRVFVTKYTGGQCINFIEQRSLLSELGGLNLRGTEWPDSVKSTLVTFLKSPNFVWLDLLDTNLKIDFDMAACFIERFSKGNLPMNATLRGKTSVTLKTLEGLCRQYANLKRTHRNGQNVAWTAPGRRKRKLVAYCNGKEFYLHHV